MRHAIYLGLALLATGQALAWGSRPVGEPFAAYRRRTKLIIPYLL